MAFCKNCGTKLGDDSKFCPGCGTIVEAPQSQAQAEQNAFTAKFAEINNTADTTADYNTSDIEQNKLMALLAYLGPIVFVPMFVQKESKFAKFHSNQGLTLFIAEAVYAVIQVILTIILRLIFPVRMYGWFYYTRGDVYNICIVLLGLLWIPFVILSVIGIINTLNGKAKELPIIGKFTFLK